MNNYKEKIQNALSATTKDYNMEDDQLQEIHNTGELTVKTKQDMEMSRLEDYNNLRGLKKANKWMKDNDFKWYTEEDVKASKRKHQQANYKNTSKSVVKNVMKVLEEYNKNNPDNMKEYSKEDLELLLKDIHDKEDDTFKKYSDNINQQIKEYNNLSGYYNPEEANKKTECISIKV